MKKLFAELKERWISESPIFWKKILKIVTFIGMSAVTLLGAEETFHLIERGVPSIIFTIASYIIVVCTSIGLSAKITKQ